MDTRVIVVFGLPGSGKSYFARKLSKRLGVHYRNTDLLRKQMFSTRSYSEKEENLVYRKLFQITSDHLSRAESIVLDGTFHSSQLRKELIAECSAFNIYPIFILIYAEESLIRGRVQKKRPDSEADYKVYELMKSRFEPATGEHLELRSEEGNIELMLDRATKYLEQ